MRTLDPRIKIYGDLSYRGKCQKEDQDQIEIIDYARNELGLDRLPLHINNEYWRNDGGRHMSKDKAKGLQTGASDIIIPSLIPMVMEVKRRNPSKHWVSEDQEEYLVQAYEAGSFSCVVLGSQNCVKAFSDWMRLNEQYKKTIDIKNRSW